MRQIIESGSSKLQALVCPALPCKTSMGNEEMDGPSIDIEHATFRQQAVAVANCTIYQF